MEILRIGRTQRTGPTIIDQPGPRSIASSSLAITNPTAYWKLDEASLSTTWADQVTSPAACNLTAHGTVNSAVGIINGSASFGSSNANGLFIIGTPAKMQTTGVFSFCCWVQIASTITNYQIALMSSGASWSLSLASSNWRFTLFSSGKATASVTSSTAVSANTWVFLVCVYDGTNAKISVNGGGFSSTAGLVPALPAAFQFGAGQTGAGNASCQYVDESGWWLGHALTATEIGLLYNGGAAVTYSTATGWIV